MDIAVCAQVQDGRLCNISRRVPEPGDVVLDAFPTGFGPFKLQGREAVELSRAELSRAERFPAGEHIAALVLLASGRGTAVQRAQAQALVDSEGAKIAQGW